jgi:hypothetical protein
MKFHWLFIALIPMAAVIVAWIGIARDAREQTVFLERIAETIERATAIPLETEHAIHDTIASIRRRASSADEGLETRQRLAIDRIEARISQRASAQIGQAGAQTRGIASRDMSPREGPAE